LAQKRGAGPMLQKYTLTGDMPKLYTVYNQERLAIKIRSALFGGKIGSIFLMQSVKVLDIV
jgi:hypothetical protein